MVVEKPQKVKAPRKISITKLVISIVACEAIGGAGSIFTIGAIPTWYTTIQKPSFNPPNWLFGPIWTTLFFLMGVSLYLIWTSTGASRSGRNLAFVTFAVQFALNLLWSALFFGLHQIFFGLVEIIVLWGAIALAISASYRVSRVSASLLLPYIAWVTIAALLNYYVWVLN